MTAQIGDTVVFEGRSFDLAGIDGTGLFAPDQIGLDVVMISTACWDGFYCTYSLINSQLYLTKLSVGLGDEDEVQAERGVGPVHFGQIPQRDMLDCESYDSDADEFVDDTYWSDWYYDGFMHPVPFTGGLLIGDRFIQEMYVHMGYHPAYKYLDVFELTFVNGKLTDSVDQSQKMAEFRLMIANRESSPKDSTRAEIKRWIEQAFSRKYRL